MVSTEKKADNDYNEPAVGSFPRETVPEGFKRMFKPIEHGFVPPCSELVLGNTLLTIRADFFNFLLKKSAAQFRLFVKAFLQISSTIFAPCAVLDFKTHQIWSGNTRELFTL